MPTPKQITAQYIENISKEVINNFASSYQTYQSSGGTWRQEIEYKPFIEKFVFEKTGLFLVLLDKRDRHDLNFMYNVCYDISNYLAKYLVKKSPDLTEKSVQEYALKKIYFNNNMFVNVYKTKRAKRYVNNMNAEYKKINKGIVEMAKYLGR